MESPPRVRSADLMKGVAVVFMIQVHLTEVFARPEVGESFPGELSLFLGGPLAAPVFLGIMGYFLAASNKTFVQLMRRGGGLILLGLFLNIGLNFHLLARIMTGASNENPWNYILGADILFSAGAGVIIAAIFRRFSGRKIWPFILMALVFPAISLALPAHEFEDPLLSHGMAFVHSSAAWSYFPMVPWLGYVFAGYSLKLILAMYPGIRDFLLNKGMLTSILLLVPIIAGFGYGWRTTIVLGDYYHHHLAYFLWVLALLALWTVIARSVAENVAPEGIFKGLEWLGRNVTAVYVVQWLIIGNIGTAIYQTQFPLPLALWFTAVLSATVLVVRIWVKFREARHLKSN